MALANALHHGSLRQFSAQYGGWLSIKVALFSRALVMDPDANLPSSVVTPRRRRHSSAAKAQWMELLSVATIVDVRKDDKRWSLEDDSPSAALSPPAAARRSRRSSAAEFVSMGYGFTVVTTTAQQTFQFEAATESEREEWIRALLLAKKLLCAEQLGANRSDRTDDQDASDSDDSSNASDASDMDDDASDNESSSSSRGVSSIRSAQPLSSNNKHEAPVLQNDKRKAITLTIVHVTATDDATGMSVSVPIPLTDASQELVTVQQVKRDALQQLRRQLHARQGTLPAGLLQDVLHRDDADLFLLCYDDKALWFKDEQRSIGFYLRTLTAASSPSLTDAADALVSPTAAFAAAPSSFVAATAIATDARPSDASTTKRSLVIALRPINTMPHALLHVAIATTKTHVSDLSGKSFTTYAIDVTFHDLTWQLARRYNAFDALQRDLKAKFAAVATHLPTLPPKHLFTPLDGAFVDTRRTALERYLQQLVLHPLIGTDVLLLSFLGVVSTARDRVLGHSASKAVLHITTLHRSLDCGDIVLFSCRFGASVLQRKFTGASYDHIGIVVPGASRNLLRIIEATSDGIQVYSLKARLLAYAREVSNVIAVRHIDAPRPPELIARLRRFVERVEGNPYSILGILRSQSESDRKTLLDTTDDSSGTTATATVGSNSISSLEDATAVRLTVGSDSNSNSNSNASNGSDASHSKRKYFCSSLAASMLKHVGWLSTTRSSSHFWPGSFEDGGEIEQLLRVCGVARMAPEVVIDCRIVEVGLATHQQQQ